MASRIITRTIYGSALQTVRQLGLKYEVLEHTTLNQAISEPTIVTNLPTPLTAGMEIAEDYDYEVDTDNLYAQYLVIGNGGHVNINNPQDAVPYSKPVAHRATDSGLFNMMPFVMRPIDDDLTIAERRKYALRRTIHLNGVLYAAYYARKIDFNRTTPDMNITSVIEGEEVVEQFVPTINNLRPQHAEEDTSYEGTYANVSSPIQIVFDSTDIQNLKEACRLMFGNEYMAIISEIAVCSGVEKQIVQRYPAEGAQVPMNTAANTFFEAVACQVNVFITTYVPIAYADQEYTLSLDLGATEPLFGVDALSAN